MNGVVREKKRFENALDDCVAAGLNAGTEVLMNQVSHDIPREAKELTVVSFRWNISYGLEPVHESTILKKGILLSWVQHKVVERQLHVSKCTAN